MGLSEDIQDLNRRITALDKKQDEAKKTLAVEEHKLKELEAQLKAEGYDVSKLSDEGIDALLDKLSDDITAEHERLEQALASAETKFEQFQALR